MSELRNQFDQYREEQTYRPLFFCADTLATLKELPSETIDFCMTGPLSHIEDAKLGDSMHFHIAQAAALFVIKTNEGGLLPFFNELPVGVRLIETPALEIIAAVKVLRMNSRIEYDVADFEADLRTLQELRQL